MSEASWTLIESDPAIFTSLLSSLGAKGLQVDELYSLAPDDLERLLTPIYGFIFLFKHLGNQAGPSAGTQKTPAGEHYFAHQVITNACATLALLNLTLNINDPSISIGDDLSNLKSFSSELDPQTRGWAISGYESIRQVHNSFARPDPFPMEETRPATEDDDVYHFVAYLPIGDELYELDGLKQLPVSHGKWKTGDGTDSQGWLKKAQEVIQARIETYAAGELMFNLMAICGDRVPFLQSRISQLTSSSSPSSSPDLQSLQIRLEDELDKRKQWEVDNSIRRHNHVGLAHALLGMLAKKGKLEEAKGQAREKQKQRREMEKNLLKRGVRKGILEGD